MKLPLSRTRLRELLHGAATRRVLVVGDAMLDVYLSGDVERISPEAPVPVVRVRERRHALGGGANVAQNVVAIGSRCDFVSSVGADAGGAYLRDMLRTLGIDDTSLVEVDRPTTQKTRIVARSQQLVRVDEEEDADLPPSDICRVRDSMLAAIATADALVLEDYNKGVLVADVITSAIAAAQGRGIPIVVDPKYRNFFLYGGATVFKPNRRELEAALGAAVDIDHPKALPATLARLGVQNILLTLGDRGMMLLAADGTVTRLQAMAREVYDVVGAGDTVTAYVAAMLAAGGTPVEAATIANIAASIEVGKLGAATVSPTEVIDFVEEHGVAV